jgi:YD repeat-containing protein
VAGATTTLAYDGYGRTRTLTGSDAYTVTIDYDLFDRPTRVTYQDGTYKESTYQRLDLAARRDRLRRMTRYFYDPLRCVTATRDPLGRTVTQEWCGCGALEAVIDPAGNRTRWERDAQSRVIRELRADGSAIGTGHKHGDADGDGCERQQIDRGVRGGCSCSNR